uniref:Uncharacterized protein n=1 Tax=Setaria italica TaxID=4555 RepID=K3XR80_SETIT
MAAINKTKFKVLELNGKNYQTWALDCEFHLEAMQLTSTIARPAASLKLQERFGKQKAVLLPQVRCDWAQLRFVDFKTLRFCGQVVTELEMIEKTLETFHPTNMLLMKNFNMHPDGTQAQPEAHASFHNNKGSKGEKFKKYMNGGQKHNSTGKSKSSKGSKGDANGAKHSNSVAMDVDPISNSAGGDSHAGDEDYDLDDEDLLDME